jgi:Response regulator containing a CheY-like receiver domain and an HTH DNA-binding domain
MGTAMQTTRVLLVEDNDLIRAGVRQLLSRAPEFEIVAEAKNGREGVDLTISLKPDVVLMDLRMPEVDGASASRCILAAQPDVKIVMVTSDDSAHAERLAKSVGAVAMVTKDECATALIPKLRSVVGGDPANVAPAAE